MSNNQFVITDHMNNLMILIAELEEIGCWHMAAFFRQELMELAKLSLEMEQDEAA